MILLFVFELITCNFCFDDHVDNWAIIVDVSNFWYNVRHENNALLMYRLLRENGFPDSHIILMISDDFLCNPRNPEFGKLYYSHNSEDLCEMDVDIDYKGWEVTEENLLRIITQNYIPGLIKNKKLLSDYNSNVLIYLTGHGGENFLKFRDKSAITGTDLTDALNIMYSKRFYLFYFIYFIYLFYLI
jgi:phosphatidylinositol glycan class K